MRISAWSSDVCSSDLEAALPARRNLRAAGNRLFEQPAVLEEAQAPRPLGDQQPAVGQEGEAPGMVEAGGQGLDAEVLLLRALDRLVGGSRRGLRERGRTERETCEEGGCGC